MMELLKNKISNWLLVLGLIASLLGLAMLSSCEKKEPLWKLPPPGNEQIDQIKMGETYETSVFYKFSTKEKTEKNLNTWHLAFESSAIGSHIKMNGGIAMQIYNSRSTNFSATITADPSSNWDWDTPDGSQDSIVISNWMIDESSRISKLEVYVLDMGLSYTPKYKKMQVLSVTDTSYTIKFANLDNTQEQTKIILKSTFSSYTYFDFTTNETVDFEPAPEQYDILFTRYRYIFYEQGTVTPYLVNGVLLNSKNTFAIQYNNTNFDSVTYNMVKDISFSAKQDTIGHDWKFYDFDLSKYTITPNLYIVKDAENNLWKLQFFDFYNDAGTKGYPKFKFKRL